MLETAILNFNITYFICVLEENEENKEFIYWLLFNFQFIKMEPQHKKSF